MANFKSLNNVQREVVKKVYGLKTEAEVDAWQSDPKNVYKKNNIIKGKITKKSVGEGIINPNKIVVSAEGVPTFPNEKIKENFLNDLKKKFESPLSRSKYTNKYFTKKYPINIKQVNRLIPYLSKKEKLKYAKGKSPETQREFVRSKRKETLFGKKGTSSSTFEGRVVRIKKGQDLDLAHRIAKNITQTTNTLGLDAPIINQVIVKPSENLINGYYKTQKNIGKKILNTGQTPKLLKQLDNINTKIFAESLRTKGRVIGSVLLPNRKGGLVSKFVGINPKLSIDFGIFDQDIKSLEKEIGLNKYKYSRSKIGSERFYQQLQAAGGNPQKAALFYNKILPSVIEYNKLNPFKEEDLKDLMNTKQRQTSIINAASTYDRKDLIPILQKIFKRIPLVKTTAVVASPFVASGIANASIFKTEDKYVNAYENFKNENQTEENIQTAQADQQLETAQTDQQLETAQTYDEYPGLDNVYASASMSDVPYISQPQRTPITEVADVSSVAKVADDLMYDNVRKVFVKRNEPEVKATQSDILYWLADNVITESPIASIGVGTAALSIPGAKETFEAARKTGKGSLRSTASVLGKGLSRVGGPLGTAVFEVPFIAEQVKEGRSPYEILSDPLNYIGPALMETLAISGGAIKGPPRGILGSVKDTLTFEGVRNPRKAAPGLLPLALRLGIAPKIIAGIAGVSGYGALALGLLQAGELGYRAYKGEFDDLFSSEEDIDSVTPKYLNLETPKSLDITGIMGLKNET